ncbi:NADH dehydrogenase 1 alpha subcomplex assembly factor 3 [Phellopilus nigrolimitatus]|nr:NADH dehydrogenase 1 alpha subcomplex assembly factor 3 [Phellopilus nigrolimitatus]
MLRLAARQLLRSSVTLRSVRNFSSTPFPQNGPTKLNNILDGGPAPPVQVRGMTAGGIELADGLILPSACIFLDGHVFLWDVPSSLWSGWGKERFELFEVVVPKPEILILGTGKSVSHPPPSIKMYLNSIGIQLDVMDTWNACTTYNLLAEEGRRVACCVASFNTTFMEAGTNELDYMSVIDSVMIHSELFIPLPLEPSNTKCIIYAVTIRLILRQLLILRRKATFPAFIAHCVNVSRKLGPDPFR